MRSGEKRSDAMRHKDAYQQMIADLEVGSKLFGDSQAGRREQRAADLLRFLGDPRDAIAWNEAKGWHRVTDSRATTKEK